jgi:hypothetical protein
MPQDRPLPPELSGVAARGDWEAAAGSLTATAAVTLWLALKPESALLSDGLGASLLGCPDRFTVACVRPDHNLGDGCFDRHPDPGIWTPRFLRPRRTAGAVHISGGMLVCVSIRG